MRILLSACLAMLIVGNSGLLVAQNSDSLRVSNNRIYTSERHLFKVTPSAFLTRLLTARTPGTALDVGMGQGRNALWLAEHGWKVTGFDPSDAALAEAQDQARKRNVKIETVLSTYQQFDFGQEKWDLIVLEYFFPRGIVPKLLGALRPNGLVLLEYYHTDAQRTRLIDGTQVDELSKLFGAYRILHYETAIGAHDWGLTLGKEQPTVRFLAQKPGPAVSGCSWKDVPVNAGGTTCWDERNFFMRCTKSGWEYAGKCPDR